MIHGDLSHHESSPFANDSSSWVFSGRLSAGLLISGTEDSHIVHALVKDGWCSWHRKYAPGDAQLEKLEAEAREAKKGVWADPHPVPPWAWRKFRR